MRSIFNTVLSLIFLCIFLSCSQNKKPEKDFNTIDQNILLSVGNVHLTGYEFDKNYTAFKQTFTSQHNRSPAKTDSGQWLQDYVAKAYFLADAEQKGYYKRKDIDQTLSSMENLILFQPDGLLEQKLVADLTPAAVRKEMERSKKQIQLQYILFPDEQTARKIMKEANGMDWQAILSKSLKVNATTGRDKYKWPFVSFWSENKSIAELNQGQTSSLVKIANSFYVVHADQISYLKAPVLNENQMRQRLKQEVLKRYYEQIQESAQLAINEENLFKMLRQMNAFKRANYLNKDQLSNLLKNSLATYRMPGETQQQITVDDFISYYNALPIRRPVEDANSIKNYLSTIAYEVYTLKDAKQMGITEDPKFILDRKNYKNTLVYIRYEQDHLTDTSAIAETEIRQVYDSMKARLNIPVEITYSLFSFKTKEQAFQGKLKIQQSKNADTTTLESVLSSKRHQKINFNDKELVDTLKKMLWEMRTPQVSFPIAFNKKYVLLIKEAESGSRTKSMAEAMPILVKEIREKRLRSNRQAKLDQLVKIFPKKGKLSIN